MPKKSKVQQQLSAMKTQLNGRKIKVKGDPPPTTLVPWNTLVLEFYPPGGTSPPPATDVGDIITLIRTQLGLISTQNIEFRVDTLRTWSQESGGAATLTVYDPTQPDQNILLDAKDKAPLSAKAGLGYVYPSYISRQPLGGTTDLTRKLFQAGTKQECRYYITWRPILTTSPPTNFVLQKSIPSSAFTERGEGRYTY